MPIRKYGNEPAQTEVRVEDNDSETLRSLASGDRTAGRNDEPYPEPDPEWPDPQ